MTNFTDEDTDGEEPGGPGALPVAALLADSVIGVDADATLLEVADTLATGDIGALIVGDTDRPVGIVTERDLVAALAARRPMDVTTALDVATTELVWCEATVTVADAAAEMCQRYVRHVLVEEDGRLVGIVSARDLLGVYAGADMEL